ncbi:MAG: AMMECR1 domain-containing protein [Thermoplasmata archaeon M11B2D]|nr:MAG: AMMECR1 domain-containing protein [Thermoplasmata archaeon M11B2D]PNX53077.1 MAG: AMMECR1 domain-containing protein [Thermoplasmata archaeon M9B2D]
MLSIDQGTKAVQFARLVLEEYVRQGRASSSDLGLSFQEKQGVFVTIHTFPDHDLRGCIGIPLPVLSLKDAIIESAQSVTHDPRFPPLEENELDAIIVEVTILTKPTRIIVKHPKDYPSQIIIGKDGLLVEDGFTSGLLLPQVPVEQGWNEEEYLSHTCMKAGLPLDAWVGKDIKISKFQGQIFTEIKPHGLIEEKRLDGPQH